MICALSWKFKVRFVLVAFLVYFLSPLVISHQRDEERASYVGTAFENPQVIRGCWTDSGNPFDAWMLI